MGHFRGYLYFELGDGVEGPYGLSCAQRHPRALGASVLELCSWYTGSGEILGFGDVSIDDLIRLARQIEPDDTFIIVQYAAADALGDSLKRASQRARGDTVPDSHCPHCLRHLKTGRYVDNVDPTIHQVMEVASIIVRQHLIIAIEQFPQGNWWRDHWFKPGRVPEDINLQTVLRKRAVALVFGSDVLQPA